MAEDDNPESHPSRGPFPSGTAPDVDLVALDVDGTLLTPDHRIAESTRTAVATARRRGARLILASSRGPVALSGIQSELDLRDEWFIAFQGALVARWVDAGLEMLASTPIDVGLAQAIEGRALAAGLSVGRYAGCEWRVPRMTSAIEREAAITGEIPLLSGTADGYAAPHKVLVIADGERSQEALEALARSLRGVVSATFSHGNYLEITAASVDKAYGLRPLMARLSVAIDRTAAVGDGLNDLGLFSAVARPVAMGQARPEVRAAASWVTTCNSQDGVARALAHLGLTGPPGRRPFPA